MSNSVFIGEEGLIIGVRINQGDVVLQRDYFLSADDACGYPEDFFDTISEKDLEDMGAEYVSGKWGMRVA